MSLKVCENIHTDSSRVVLQEKPEIVIEKVTLNKQKCITIVKAMSGSCTQCRSNSLSRDDTTGHLVCDACGLLQEFDSFEAQLGGISGPTGTFVSVGTAGYGSVFSYKEKKLYEAQKILDDIVFRLGLSASKSSDVKAMVAKITDGEYGLGRWFSIFVGACAYVIMRAAANPLAIADVCSAIGCGCEDHELGRMVKRVVQFLNLRGGSDYPEFNIATAFERAMRNSPSFAAAGREEVERMRGQGVFLIQCMVKWSLTTGRRPIPAVAAVLTLVGELNCIGGAKIDDVARQLNAKVHTSKCRYRELLEALVKVAKALPWGENVNVKNIVKNAPLVIQYMEKRSMSRKAGGEGRGFELIGLDLREAVGECFKKGIDYGTELVPLEGQDDSGYFELSGFDGKIALPCSDKFKLSSECLSMVCAKFSNEVAKSKAARTSVREELHRRRERGEFDADTCMEWWSGESELSKKLMLKQILEKDVGLDALPPSFVAGCTVYEKRREKINAAKRRIDRIMRPGIDGADECNEISANQNVQTGKKRKGKKIGAIDWEDLIIETLILHELKDEEIETGHYNTLLDLYVFNSGIDPSRGL